MGGGGVSLLNPILNLLTNGGVGGVTFIQSTGVIHHLKTRSIFCV